ncbi:MAG: NYN domain-containing protein [Candidatus Kerfeldbacteria bacterium]|nr:NYN domain-containing protein [Candidatus Kerfeldbacteria bacterium]
MKTTDQRVGVFVDVANMYYSAKNIHGTRVNFGKILEEASDNRRLVRAIAYVIRADTPEEQKFFDALGKQGFEVKMKDLQVFPGGAKKGDWDVGITIDAIRMADRLDTIVLVAGDGDYVPLVRYLQEAKGCRVEVMAFQESTAMKLREAADAFVDLSSDKKKYLLPIRTGIRPQLSSIPRPRIFPGRSRAPNPPSAIPPADGQT